MQKYNNKKVMMNFPGQNGGAKADTDGENSGLISACDFDSCSEEG